MIGLVALFLAAYAHAVPAPGFTASVVGVAAMRENAGVRLDWKVDGGAEVDPHWVVEARAAGASSNRVWNAVGMETELGLEPNRVRYSAWIPADASVDALDVRLWAEGLQDKPEKTRLVSVMAPPTAPALPAPQRAPLAMATSATSEPAARVRLVVSETARYVVTAAQIAVHLAPGDEALIRTWIATTNLSITCMGEPVAWHPVDNGASIAFIGMAYRDVYTDRNVYWIEPGPGLAMATAAVAVPAPPHEIGTFWCETRFETDRYLFGLLPAERPVDAWHWDVVDTSSSLKIQSVLLPFAAPDAVGEGNATLRLWARSFFAYNNQPPHGSLTLSLGGDVVGAFPVTGAAPEILICTLSQSILDDANALKVAVFTNTTPRMRYALDSITLGYRRRMMARDGQLLLTLPPGETNVVAGGFTTNAVDAYSLGASGSTLRLAGAAVAQVGATWQCAYLAPDSKGGPMLLTSGSRAPDVIEGVPADPWAGDDHEVDYLVISPEAFLPTLQPLLALRAQQFKVGIVTTEQLYRDNNGGRFSPYAVRELLLRSRTWRAPPAMALLVGHGHYDYFNKYDSLAWQPNFIAPALVDVPYVGIASGRIFYGRDNDLADLDLDGVPDVPIGRLPVRSEPELVRVVAKILSYESRRFARTNAVAVADLKYVDASSSIPWNFEQNASEWNALLPPRLARTLVSEPLVGTPEDKRLFIRAVWRARLKAGVWISGYFGHAAAEYIGDFPSYIKYNDVASLENQGRTGILLGTTCQMNNLFMPSAVSTAQRCVGSELLVGADGGMVAVLAPTSHSFEPPGRVLANGFADSIARRRRRYLGEGVRDALVALRESDSGSPWLTQTFLLLGDPALDLRPAEGVFPQEGTLIWFK